MKDQSRVHVAWAVVAAASFFLGAHLFQGEGELGMAKLDTGGGNVTSPLTVGDAGSGRVHSTPAPLGGVLGHTARTGERSLTLSRQEIVSLGEQFRSASSPIDRRLAFSRLIEGLTAENATLVRDQIAHLDARNSEFREFHYAWGAVGGVGAVMSGADTPEDDMAPTLAGWAGKDPTAALDWFGNLDMDSDEGFAGLLGDRKIPADGLRDHLMGGLVYGLATTDPDAASDFVHSVADPGNRAAGRMIHTVAEAVTRSMSPADAADWSENLPEGGLRDQVMRRMAGHFAGSDPVAAAGWAEKFTDQPEQAGVFAGVGSRWAAGDPVAATSWLEGLPPGRTQSAGMNGALREWAGRDPAAASEFLTAMPTSGAKDAAISGFSERLAWEDPQSAVTWAASITSDELRVDTLTRAGQAWARRDPTAAADWAISSGLPEDLQLKILSPPQGDRRR